MSPKILIVTIDGGGVDYFEAADIPNIRKMVAKGFFVEGSSMIPSVTNVNNVSIVTGKYPSQHGITSNYWYRPETGEGVYMESPEFVMTETVFQRVRSLGMRSVLLTSKDKLKRILEPGTDFSFSAETPPKEIIEAVGPTENIYSAEINHWLFRSLHYVIREYHPDLMYISTTDYIMHKYPPSHEIAIQHLNCIDRILGEVLNDYPEMEVYITADHGMNSKEKAINLKQVLSVEGIVSEFVPVIKDRYVVHHDNLGGIAYLYLLSDSNSKTDKEKLRERATEVLSKVPEVEEIYTREEAAASFHLLEDRIGDLLVLGTEKAVFGEFDDEIREVSIRSHGSRYESKVPIIGYNSKVEPSEFKYNLDVVKNLKLDKS